MHDGRYILGTVDNALALLELLAANPAGMDLKRIALSLSLPKATVYRLCFTLQRRGYVERDPDSKKYCLDLRLLTLGLAVQAHSRLGAEITPFLEELVAQCGETANVGTLRHGEVVLVNKIRSPHMLRVDSPIGGREPAHATAMGKVLLASLPPDQLTAFITDGQPLPRLTPRTVTDPDELLAELHRVSIQGYAVDLEESYAGLACVGAPIVDHRGHVIAALSVSGPTARMIPARLEELASLVRHVAGRISLRLGYSSASAAPLPSRMRGNADAYLSATAPGVGNTSRGPA